jgi:uncharacterized protein (TIGR02246 family)
MKKHISVLSFALLAAATALSAQAEETMNCVKTNEKVISALFNRWNASLATLDPDKVVANYAPDAVLLPTVSNKMRTNHAEIRDYFVHFLHKKPQGKINNSIIKIGCNIASDTGIYTFTLHEKNGKVEKMVARYSYVYEYQNGQWLIEHHHSSAMPEQIGAKTRKADAL